MMHSDYLALSACAFSVLYVPFLMIAQLRFAHIMQNRQYDTKQYFLWIKKNFLLCYVPLIGISVVHLMAEATLLMYLRHTSFYELAVIIGYLLMMLLIASVIAMVFTKYIRYIKIESEVTPIYCSNRLITLFMVSGFCVCALTLFENLWSDMEQIVFFTPLITPFFVPLVNVLMRLKKKQTT